MPESLFAGSAVGYVTAEIVAKVCATPDRRAIRSGALAAAAIAGVVVNTLAETTFGQRIAGFDDVPNYIPNHSMVDFIWGVGSAVVGAAILVKSKHVGHTT